MSNAVSLLLTHKDWADRLVYEALLELPEIDLVKQRRTTFGSIQMTLNHVYVVDDIFRHHLLGEPHSYHARNTETGVPLPLLYEKQRTMNRWLLETAGRLTEAEMAEVVPFAFVGGGEGAMTREEIFLHLASHATYHRGYVSDMTEQDLVSLPANDLTVFLRDAAKRPGRPSS